MYRSGEALAASPLFLLGTEGEFGLPECLGRRVIFWSLRGTVSRGSGFSSVGNIAKQEAAHEV
jgi:hypothetical protein